MRALVICLGAACVVGCHTMTFEVSDEPTSAVVAETNHYFMWGLVPPRLIDVSEKCPAGAVEIREQTTFLNGICNAVTLGFWFPRSVTYTCAQGGGR